jgi:hypothetical protein
MGSAEEELAGWIEADSAHEWPAFRSATAALCLQEASWWRDEAHVCETDGSLLLMSTGGPHLVIVNFVDQHGEKAHHNEQAHCRCRLTRPRPLLRTWSCSPAHARIPLLKPTI